MSYNVMYKVAIELGFPNRTVERALKKYKFKSAGSLVDYIETHREEFEVDNEEEEAEADEEKITIACFPTEDESNKAQTEAASSSHISQLTLREQTEILYRRSICLMCHKNRRCFVILPCSHFALCATCEPSTRKCPLLDCQEYISCTIQTYGV